MRSMSRIAIGLLGLQLLGMGLAAPAMAGCATPSDSDRTPGKQPPLGVHLSPIRLLSRVSAPASDNQNDGGIVGFWRVTFVSKESTYIPDGTVVDWGYVQWHSDGTEVMNSSRPPATSSFCLGVWEKTGPFTYKLRHLALSWNPDGTFLGPATITEEVVLDRKGDSYSGSFVITQYDASGSNTLPPTPIVGVVTGRRITVE